MCISLLGDGMFMVAMAWQVYALSNAPTALSLVGFAMAVPTIALLLFGGVVCDRVDRRRVMLAADVTRGLAVGVLALLSLTGALALWHMIALVAVYGAGAAFALDAASFAVSAAAVLLMGPVATPSAHSVSVGGDIREGFVCIRGRGPAALPGRERPARQRRGPRPRVRRGRDRLAAVRGGHRPGRAAPARHHVHVRH